MHVSLLFWLLLLLPGYAAARLFDEKDSECGVGMIGLATFWAFVLLSPVSILCYTLRLPVIVLSSAWIGIVVTGIVVIHRRRWWKVLRQWCVACLGIELMLVVADLIMGGRVGGFLSGDAEVHLARIRYLIEHGISNQDPFAKNSGFFALYHTNLLHALHAACAQLTGSDYLEVWRASLVWAKAAAFGGTYYLAWCVVRSRWSAWAPALYLLATVSPVAYLVYPNQLSVCWLMPITLGFALRTLAEKPSRLTPVKLAAASIVLGQIHALYAVFAGLVIAPVLVVLLILRLFRRQGERWLLANCVLALLAGAPFVLAGRYAGERPPPDPRLRRAVTGDEAAMNAAFAEHPGGNVSLKWSQFLEGQAAWRLALLGAGGVLLIFLGRRAEGAGVLAITAVVLLALFLPAACTALVKMIGERWVLLRIGAIVALTFAVAVVGAAALVVERYYARWWSRALLGILAAFLGCIQVYDRKEHGWNAYSIQARRPLNERRAYLAFLQRLREFYAEHIPRGSVVLAQPKAGRGLVAFHNCFIVVPDRGGGVSLDMMDRRRDMDRLIALDTPWPERRRLLERYGIDRILVTGGIPRWWTPQQVRGQVAGPGVAIVVLHAN